ncbi:MAG: starch-binding protein [Acholeplasmatales bacterium]|nr:starch-binding protein [Acholeplasmatales bacterium]
MTKRKIIVKVGLSVGAVGITLLTIGTLPKVNNELAITTVDNNLTTLANDSSDFADSVQDGQILQCFCWSYKEIMEYLPKIASQGFTAIQTSPVQVCKEQTIDDGEGNSRTAKGMWWAYYQPAAFTIDDTGDNALGTPEEFSQMVEMAHSYGVKVLVDVVANHLGNQWVADSLCERAYYYEWEIAGMPCSYEDGGYIPYTGNYWAYGSNTAVPQGSANASDTKEINTYYYADTLKFHPYSIQDNDEAGNITQGNIGMMDLDTSDPVVQDAVADYLEELISYGVDGFRFDAAKHIETPYDDISSSFWPTVINRAKNAASAKGQDLYCYGEILNRQGIGRKLSWYTSCGVNITDSGMGHNIVENGGSGFSNFNYADGEDYSNYRTQMVTWAESHDNYMGTQDTHNKSEDIINKSYAILGARKDFCTLYCARFEDYENSYLGDVACLNGWSYDCVGAINKFHNHFAKLDASESCFMSNNYTCIERHSGSKSSDNGMVIVGNSGVCNVSCSYLSDGTYTDVITGNTFLVNNGSIYGNIGDSGIAVIYNAAPITTPSITTSMPSGSFKADSLSVTYKFKNAASVSITVDGNKVNANPTSTTINVNNIDEGQTIFVVVEVYGIDGTTLTEVYTYTRVEAIGAISLYFANNYNWTNVNAYCWNDSTGAKNASWPGVALTETAKDEDGNTCYVCEFDLDVFDHIIFNDGSSQTVDISVTDSKEYIISGTNYNKFSVSESEFKPYTGTDNPDPVDPDPEDPEVLTVYFKNDNNWTNVNAYMWNSQTLVNNGQWPGVAINSVGMDIDGYTAYALDVDLTQFDRIIFNDGNNQTDDLFLSSTTTGFTVNGSAYTFTSYVNPDPEDPVDPELTTIYFANTNNWTNVNAYMWNSQTLVNNAQWPGVKLDQIGTDNNGNSVYSVNIDLNDFDRIIFNDGSNQTDDLVLTSTTTGFTATGEAYNYDTNPVSNNEITLYYADKNDWSDVYVYLWNSQTYNQASSWPGIKLEVIGTDTTGYKVYSVTVDLDEYDRVIFTNNNGGQTVDLEITNTTTGFIQNGYDGSKLTCTNYSYN